MPASTERKIRRGTYWRSQRYAVKSFLQKHNARDVVGGLHPSLGTAFYDVA